MTTGNREMNIGHHHDNNNRASKTAATTTIATTKTAELAPAPAPAAAAAAAEHLKVTIVSAKYTPCEGRRLPTGELVEGDIDVHTRDVTPFLRALLIAQKKREEEAQKEDWGKNNIYKHNNGASSSGVSDNDDYNDYGDEDAVIRLNAVSGGRRRAQIRLLDQKQKWTMNAIFGDPVPGTSKRLYVHYIIAEDNPNRQVMLASAETQHMSFAEHERVFLRRRELVYRDHQAEPDSNNNLRTTNNTDASASVQTSQQRIDSSQSTAETAAAARQTYTSPSTSTAATTTSGRLQPATSEVVLPLAMEFLGVWERVQCRLVCSVWKKIIREWGVATTIDDNDPTFPIFTRRFLRGILSHSHQGLHSLFLSGTPDISPADLHPAIPHLRKLRSLDLSRCVRLDDSTLHLLAQHVAGTLEVFYLKGLRNVTDDGLIAIARSCHKLKVVDISNLFVTDRSVKEIGLHLTDLRAIYMRDNYRLTNESVDVITENCTSLDQLTLWGCTLLNHLSFRGNLVLLNLWGCHSLNDDAAQALQGMNQLRTLVMSECHRLSDEFVTSLVQYAPQLNHLHLRYCKRITDTAVNAIAQNMLDLYSLDLSFCTRVTVPALYDLLERRGHSLAELRLQSCRTLDIARDPQGPLPQRGLNEGRAGRQILSVLRSLQDRCCLSVLDVRLCGGQRSLTAGYPNLDPFVQGIQALGFVQKAPGFFSRPAKWNPDIEKRLVEQFLYQGRRFSKE